MVSAETVSPEAQALLTHDILLDRGVARSVKLEGGRIPIAEISMRPGELVEKDGIDLLIGDFQLVLCRPGFGQYIMGFREPLVVVVVRRRRPPVQQLVQGLHVLVGAGAFALIWIPVDRCLVMVVRREADPVEQKIFWLNCFALLPSSLSTAKITAAAAGNFDVFLLRDELKLSRTRAART